MKKIIIAGAVIIQLTGCAQFLYNNGIISPVQKAKSECEELGYKPGTNNYNQCVLITADKIRAAPKASRTVISSQPQSTNCMRTGNMVQCNSY